MMISINQIKIKKLEIYQLSIFTIILSKLLQTIYVLDNPIILQYYLEFYNFLRVFGVDFTLPEPSQLGHRFLKSPLPVAPEP